MENNEKIFGVYSGTLKLDIVETLEEWELFSHIQHMGGTIWRINHDKADGRPWANRVSEAELLEMQYELEYLVYQTKKYGVTFSREPEAGKHIERSEDYNKWYRFWNNHFDSMSEDEINAFNDALKNKEDITKYLPKTTWNGNKKAGV